MFQKPLYQPYVSRNDQELLELYHAGDQDAITALIARYANLINRSASNYHISGVDNEDIKQEAYMGLFNAIRNYRSNRGTGFYTYATHCITNKLKNYLAAASTKKAQLYKNSVSIDEVENYMLTEQIHANPEMIYIQNEDYESIMELTNSVLSELERNVLFLYFSGCDYNLIATKLNSSQKSVDNALQRARRKLKAVLNNL